MAGSNVSITEEFVFKETDFKFSASQVDIITRQKFSRHTWQSTPQIGSKNADYMPMDAVWQELEIRQSPLNLLKPGSVLPV